MKTISGSRSFSAAGIAVLLGVLMNCALAGCGGAHRSPAALVADQGPVADRVVPADAAVNVKTEFGAVGDGVADDTAALQAAISAGLGMKSSPRKVLYLPAGTYRVTRPLTWQLADGTWSTWLTLQGQNRDRTVIKLSDSLDGFQDPASPRAVVVTGSQNADGPDGAGNQAFSNFIFDLTVDVGAGNPGANGIDYLANNRGAIRNVVVRAAPSSGATGLSMTRKWPGPAMLADLTVEGFARGIVLGQSEYSVVAERLIISGQRLLGIDNQNNVLSIRGLRSDGAVTAVRNGTPASRGALLTILDSTLGQGASVPAIENHAGMLLRGVTSTGVTLRIRDHGTERAVPEGEEVASPAPEGAAHSLRLPVAEAPMPPAYPVEEYAGVERNGAHAGDDGDDTDAVQRALDSGKPVVYFRSGAYMISRTLRVPATVRVIYGFDASLVGKTGEFAVGGVAPLLSVSDPSPDPLVVTNMLFEGTQGTVKIDRAADRPVVLRDIHLTGAPFRGLPGQLFLDDVEGGQGWRFTPGQQVWARQLNAETNQLKIENDGARLWILGLKTESPSTVLRAVNGAATEVLGGLLYPVAPTSDNAPAFVSDDSSGSFTFVTSAHAADRNYHVLVDAGSGGDRRQLRDAEAPRRGKGSLVPLYQVDEVAR